MSTAVPGGAAPGPRPALVAATCGVGLGLVMFDNTAVVVALPAIGASLSASVSGLQWVAAAMSLAAAAVLPFAGAFGDRFGTRRAVRLGLVLFGLATATAAAAPSLPLLLAARAVEGAGVALMLPNSAALLEGNVSRENRGRAFGTWITVSSMGLITGPTVGGWLVGALGWRVVFLVHLPLAALGVIGTTRLAEGARRASGRFDIAGAVVTGAGLAVLCWSFIELGRPDGSPKWAFAGLAACVPLFALVVIVERRAAQPAVDLTMLRDPAYAAIMVSSLLYNGTITGGSFLVSLLFQEVRGFGPGQAGLIVLAGAIGMPLGGRLTARLAHRGGLARVMAGAIAVLAVAYVLVACAALGPTALIVVPLVLSGFAAGILYNGDTLAVLGNVEAARAASALAALSLVRQTGAVLGIAVLGSLATLAEQARLVDFGPRAGLLAAGVAVLPGVLLLRRHLGRTEI